VHEFPHAKTVTVSIGYTDNSGSETLEGLMEIADKALYKAKQDGRNRVILGSVNESS
ncbi:diguanylate cyclase, partial [Aduncisulcus paluster]